MRLHTQTTAETGPASPAIERANIELLREEGEFSPWILNAADVYYSVRGYIARLRQHEPIEEIEP